MKDRVIMDESPEARACFQAKERLVKSAYSTITSVRRPSAKARFGLLLDLGIALRELEDYVAKPTQQELEL